MKAAMVIALVGMFMVAGVSVTPTAAACHHTKHCIEETGESIERTLERFVIDAGQAINNFCYNTFGQPCT